MADHRALSRQAGVWRLLLVVVLGWGAPIVLAAGSDANYYRAQVPVESQSAADRSRAASLGLKEVLVRISGKSDIASEPGVPAELGQAGNYLELFEYGRNTDANGESQQVLNMLFAQPLVDRLLFTTGQPYWPLNRPKVLLWLVADARDEDRKLLNDPADPRLAAIKRAARERGLPLLLPLLDLDDQLAINLEQLWQLNEDAIRNASERYGVDTILVGRVTESSTGTWLSSWQYFHHSATRFFEVRTDALDELARRAVNPLADYLAERYAVRDTGEDKPRMLAKVDGIASFGEFDRLVVYFERQAMVTDFHVVRIVGDEVWVDLTLGGSLDQLRNALALDGLIATEALSAYDNQPWMLSRIGTEDLPLQLFWQGR